MEYVWRQHDRALALPCFAVANSRTIARQMGLSVGKVHSAVQAGQEAALVYAAAGA
jgi:hypothetical protein